MGARLRLGVNGGFGQSVKSGEVVSYRARERKRAEKAATRKVKAEYSDVMRKRYYLTVVKHEGHCAACGKRLRAGGEMVFRKLGPVVLCVPCADADPLVEYRPSLRYERVKKREIEARARKAAAKPLPVFGDDEQTVEFRKAA
jgi:hypothetical protein